MRKTALLKRKPLRGETLRSLSWTETSPGPKSLARTEGSIKNQTMRAEPTQDRNRTSHGLKPRLRRAEPSPSLPLPSRLRNLSAEPLSVLTNNRTSVLFIHGPNFGPPLRFFAKFAPILDFRPFSHSKPVFQDFNTGFSPKLVF